MMDPFTLMSVRAATASVRTMTPTFGSTAHAVIDRTGVTPLPEGANEHRYTVPEVPIWDATYRR
jgi:hypothetical protein